LKLGSRNSTTKNINLFRMTYNQQVNFSNKLQSYTQTRIYSTVLYQHVQILNSKSLDSLITINTRISDTFFNIKLRKNEIGCEKDDEVIGFIYP